MDEREEHKEIDLLKYWQVITERKWIILLSAGAIFLFIAISTFTQTPIYRATTRILIEEEYSKMLSIEDEFGNPRQLRDVTYFNTQLNLLRSRTLVERVAKELQLLSRPEFGAGKKPKINIIQTVRDFVLLKWIRPNNTSTQEMTGQRIPLNPYSGVARAILSGLEARPIRDTKLVDISFSSPYQDLSADIVNTLAFEFMSFSVEKRSATTQQASNFLTEVIADLHEKIDAKNQELQRFGSEKDIPVVGNESEISALASFEEYDQAYAQANIALTNALIKFQNLRNIDLQSRSTVVDDPVIQSIQADLRSNQNDYNEQRNRYGANHPRMMQLKAKIDDLFDQLQDAYQKAVEAAETDYQTAQVTARRLKRVRDDEAAKMGSSASRFRRLRIELDNLTNQLNTYTQMREETEISSQLAAFSTSNISVVDPAEIPRSPISPNKMQGILMGLFVGLFCGIGLCFLLEYLDNSIKSPDDVEDLLGIPSLGVIPYLSPEGITKNRSKYFSKYQDFYSYGGDVQDNGKELEIIKTIELINYAHPKFFISEDYRTIRTSLLLSNADSHPKSLLLTSALPMEGKTTTASNIAVAFSQLAEKVLIIDADLRKPRLHRIFEVNNMGGVSNYLSGKVSLQDAIKMSTIQNIWILPSGPIPPNPAELLNSKKMQQMLDEVQQDFDIIIIDSPPVLAAIDTVVMSSFVDAVVLVVRAGKTNKQALLRTYEEMEKARANVIGVVLNELRLDHGKYYYKNYYHGGAYVQDEE